MVTTLQDLHNLVDWLPECDREEAHQILLAQLKKHDPVAYAFFTAPEDYEPLTAEEIDEIDAALADDNPEHWLAHEEVKNRMARRS